MNLRSAIIIEVVKNERTYQLTLPVGAPYGEAYDATFEILGKILELAQAATEQAKGQQPEQVDQPSE